MKRSIFYFIFVFFIVLGSVSAYELLKVTISFLASLVDIHVSWVVSAIVVAVSTTIIEILYGDKERW